MQQKALYNILMTAAKYDDYEKTKSILGRDVSAKSGLGNQVQIGTFFVS